MYLYKGHFLGAEYYIIKPFDIDVLETRVRQLYEENT